MAVPKSIKQKPIAAKENFAVALVSCFVLVCGVF
jgi:hypothetical protein